MAIDAKEFTEKDELIAKFYTLRAGLSAAAEEAEKLREANDETMLLWYNAEDHRDEVKRKLDNELYEIKENHEARLEQLNVDFYQPRTEYYSNERRLSELTSPGAFGAFWDTTKLGIAWILFGIIGFIFSFTIFRTAGSGQADAIPVTILAIPIALLLGYLVKSFIAKTRLNMARKKCEKIMAENRHWIESYLKEIKKAESEREKQEIELAKKALDPANEAYYAEYVQERYNEKLKQFQEEVSPYYSARVDAITQALRQQFGSILMEADWENVDLLIFYLNSGRADSLKEALQLVDRQRQTDQISSAIRTAAEHISFTMQSNTYRLAQVMTGCFSELSKQIQQNHVAVLSSMDQTTEAISRLSGSVGSLNSNLQSIESGIENQNQLLLDANQLNDALLKHANKSSQDLMYELRYNQRNWQ